MAHGIKSVSRTRPCPICGHSDWCGFMQTEDGYELVICQRTLEGGDRNGADGNIYICVGQSKSSENFIFMEKTMKEDRDARRGFSSGKKEGTRTKEYVPRTMHVVDEVVPMSNDALDKVYRFMLSKMALDRQHREWLNKEGWSDELIDRNLIRTMPLDDYKRFCRKGYKTESPWRKAIARQVMEKFGTIRGIPGFYTSKDKDGNARCSIHCRSGILFPQYDLDGKIFALRVRMDFLDAASDVREESDGELSFDGEDGTRRYITPMKGIYSLLDGEKVYDKVGGKYRPFSSYTEDEEEYKKGYIVNVYKDGCQSAHSFGFYAQPSDNYYCLYITEGEKKGIFANAAMGAPFMSLPGVNSFSLLLKKHNGRRVVDILKEKGVTVIIVAFDADKATNDKVFDCQEKTVRLLKEEGFIVATAEWNAGDGKGIDDLLQNGKKPQFHMG